MAMAGPSDDVTVLALPRQKEAPQYDSKKTKEATKYSAKIFRDFCQSRGIMTAVEDLSKVELDNLLCDFYINVRTQGGQFYSFSSLVALRHGLNRYLKNTNIVNDPAFRKSTLTFKVALKRLKEAGKGSIEHKEPVSQSDMMALYSHAHVFNPNTPEGLLNKVWFEITFYFFRRGQENQRYLSPNHFGFATDEYGRKYVYKRKSLSLYRNMEAGDSNRGVRMYETGNAICPVATFERFLRKRNPHESALFQHPRTTAYQDSIWYNASPLGKEALSTMMKRISLTAKLTRIYTNHCIRATAKFVLFQVYDAFQQFDPHNNGGPTSLSCSMVPPDTSGSAQQNFQLTPINIRTVSESESQFINVDMTNVAYTAQVNDVITQQTQETLEISPSATTSSGGGFTQPPVVEVIETPVNNVHRLVEKDTSISFSTSTKSSTIFKKAYMEPEHADSMMKSLAQLWRKGKLCDAKICSGDKFVILHRLVLFAASPHLVEKNITDGADLEVNLPVGISENGLRVFVTFLYDGVLNLSENVHKDVERVSHLLKVERVEKYCKEFALSLSEHRSVVGAGGTPVGGSRRREGITRSKKSNRQTIVLTLSDDSNPADDPVDSKSSMVSSPQVEINTNSNLVAEERFPASPSRHNFHISHHDRFSVTNHPVSTLHGDSNVKAEPIEILDDFTDFSPPPAQDEIKRCKRSINPNKNMYTMPDSITCIESSGTHRRLKNICLSTVTTYPPSSKLSNSCDASMELPDIDSVAACSSSTPPYPVSLVASSGESFPLYSLSTNQT